MHKKPLQKEKNNENQQESMNLLLNQQKQKQKQKAQQNQQQHQISKNKKKSINTSYKAKQDYKFNEQPEQKSIFGTPKFPFYKWQIWLHFIHILIMLTVVIIHHQIYIQKHYQELAPKMQKSYLSNMLQAILNVQANNQSGNNENKLNFPQILIFSDNNNKPQSSQQNLIFTFYRYNADLQWQAYRSNLFTLIIIALSYKLITYFLLSKTCQRSNQIFAYTNQFSWLFGLCILMFSFRGDIAFYMGIVIGWYFYVQFLVKVKPIFVKWIGLRIVAKLKNDQQLIQVQEEKKQILQKIEQKYASIFDKISIFSFWVIMLATLYMNEQFDHFRGLSDWFQQFIPEQVQFMKNSHRAIHCSQLLNMTFLKLLSYGVDKIHSTDKRIVIQQKRALQIKHGQNCASCKIYKKDLNQKQNKCQVQYDYCYKGRDLIKAYNFSLKSYNDYVLFAPTLLTGPPISYQNYHSFGQFPTNIPKISSYLYYIFLLVSFQVYQHFFPIIRPTVDQTLLEMEIFAMFHLVYIWYKFLIIWRTAKIWAILHGVDVIDNMSRCMCDNYGFQGFWRMWHRGFNHWLIRYLYIPLGGNKNYFSVLAVVAFVAFWHDHNLNIILWAFLIVLCMIPELMIKRYFRKNHSNLYKKHWFKYLSGFAAAIYIYLLMICNLVGFGYGADQIQIVIQKLMKGWFQFIWTVIILTSACMLMFHKRNIEKGQKNY